ncbi:MAG: phosphoribosyltransferase family protein [Halofilum sp. (in: g-proteobacteria)]
MLRDREDAARQLAQRLAHLRGQAPLVLAVPRGGVPMGRIVADELGGELDVVLVHKLGAPGNPEYAIGAIDEDGAVELRSGKSLDADPALRAEAARQLERLRERRARYSPIRPPIDPADRTVIVVDDGAATGATLLAALRLVRAKAPARLVVAVGVAPSDTVARLEREVDEVVCLEAPVDFGAVGQFFQRFDQVEDEQVVELLGQGPAEDDAT